MHGLLALVDEPLLDEPSQGARDRGLIPEVHRDVGMIPVAEDAEALEFLRHHADEALRVAAARPAEVGHRHVAPPRTELALDAKLDRQTVTIVARDVRRVVARHRARLDDEVLQDLVERRSEVDLAVRVRGAIVQDEFRRAFTALRDLPVEVHGLPPGEPLRLGRREVGLHREVGPRQIDGVLPLGHGYPTIL